MSVADLALIVALGGGTGIAAIITALVKAFSAVKKAEKAQKTIEKLELTVQRLEATLSAHLSAQQNQNVTIYMSQPPAAAGEPKQITTQADSTAAALPASTSSVGWDESVPPSSQTSPVVDPKESPESGSKT